MTDEKSGFSPTSSELKGALTGGVVATVALFVMAVAVGRVASFEALSLIQAVQPGARFLASTVIAAAITVLALLLTLLGLSMNSEFSFHTRLYTRARHITRLSVACIIMGVVLLLAVGIPLEEVEELRPYYSVLYYVLTAVMAAVGGLVVAVGLMIGSTLRGLIEIQEPDAVSDLLHDSGDGATSSADR